MELMFISKWLHIHYLRRLLYSICPYRSGDRDGLPDLMIIDPLLGKSDITLFGVAIMFASIMVAGFALIYLSSLMHATHSISWRVQSLV
jgi:hypothetical protein